MLVHLDEFFGKVPKKLRFYERKVIGLEFKRPKKNNLGVFLN